MKVTINDASKTMIVGANPAPDPPASKTDEKNGPDKKGGK